MSVKSVFLCAWTIVQRFVTKVIKRCFLPNYSENYTYQRLPLPIILLQTPNHIDECPLLDESEDFVPMKQLCKCHQYQDYRPAVLLLTRSVQISSKSWRPLMEWSKLPSNFAVPAEGVSQHVACLRCDSILFVQGQRSWAAAKTKPPTGECCLLCYHLEHC